MVVDAVNCQSGHLGSGTRKQAVWGLHPELSFLPVSPALPPPSPSRLLRSKVTLPREQFHFLIFSEMNALLHFLVGKKQWVGRVCLSGWNYTQGPGLAPQCGKSQAWRCVPAVAALGAELGTHSATQHV